MDLDASFMLHQPVSASGFTPRNGKTNNSNNNMPRLNNNSNLLPAQHAFLEPTPAPIPFGGPRVMSFRQQPQLQQPPTPEAETPQPLAFRPAGGPFGLPSQQQQQQQAPLQRAPSSPIQNNPLKLTRPATPPETPTIPQFMGSGGGGSGVGLHSSSGLPSLALPQSLSTVPPHQPSTVNNNNNNSGPSLQPAFMPVDFAAETPLPVAAPMGFKSPLHVGGGGLPIGQNDNNNNNQQQQKPLGLMALPNTQQQQQQEPRLPEGAMFYNTIANDEVLHIDTFVVEDGKVKRVNRLSIASSNAGSRNGDGDANCGDSDIEGAGDGDDNDDIATATSNEVLYTAQQRNHNNNNKDHLQGLYNIDNYQVIKTIGRGGFGTVELVEHKTTKEQYAYKKQRIRMVRGEFVTDQGQSDAIESAENEAKALQCIQQRHAYTHLLRAYNVTSITEQNQQWFSVVLWLELMPRGSLRSMINEHTPQHVVLSIPGLTKYIMMNKNNNNNSNGEPTQLLLPKPQTTIEKHNAYNTKYDTMLEYLPTYYTYAEPLTTTNNNTTNNNNDATTSLKRTTNNRTSNRVNNNNNKANNITNINTTNNNSNNKRITISRPSSNHPNNLQEPPQLKSLTLNNPSLSKITTTRASIKRLSNSLNNNNNNNPSYCYYLQLETIAYIARQMLLGLQDLWENCDKMLHRDIKPENVLLNNNFVVKLADFGLTKKTSEISHLLFKRDLGTQQFLSPERKNGHLPTHQGDIWAVGITLLHAAGIALDGSTYEALTSSSIKLEVWEYLYDDHNNNSGSSSNNSGSHTKPRGAMKKSHLNLQQQHNKILTLLNQEHERRDKIIDEIILPQVKINYCYPYITVPKYKQYVESFIDFLKKCLRSDYQIRSTAKQLLQHEFLQLLSPDYPLPQPSPSSPLQQQQEQLPPSSSLLQPPQLTSFEQALYQCKFPLSYFKDEDLSQKMIAKANYVYCQQQQRRNQQQQPNTPSSSNNNTVLTKHNIFLSPHVAPRNADGNNNIPNDDNADQHVVDLILQQTFFSPKINRAIENQLGEFYANNNDNNTAQNTLVSFNTNNSQKTNNNNDNKNNNKTQENNNILNVTILPETTTKKNKKESNANINNTTATPYKTPTKKAVKQHPKKISLDSVCIGTVPRSVKNPMEFDEVGWTQK